LSKIQKNPANVRKTLPADLHYPFRKTNKKDDCDIKQKIAEKNDLPQKTPTMPHYYNPE
jgi:hypothetical protein